MLFWLIPLIVIVVIVIFFAWGPLMNLLQNGANSTGPSILKGGKRKRKSKSKCKK
jgi:F0F1-type ATP synthase membrane subunit b/b'